MIRDKFPCTAKDNALVCQEDLLAARMSTSNEQPACDMGHGPGISSATADAAQKECMATKWDETQPVTFLSHNAATQAATHEFLQGVNKTEIARILGISISHVRERLRGSRPGIFNEPEYIINNGRTDITWTILALSDLSYENGLPAIGSAKVKYKLKSGETLHFMGDLQQTYGPGGGGTLIWFQWCYLL